MEVTMRLTPNFDHKEFLVSKEKPELAASMLASELDTFKMGMLAKFYLQPIRNKYGAVNILSGKRSAELNEAVGGSLGSMHLYRDDEAAVDFTVANGKTAEIFEEIKSGKYGVFGELIYYPSQNFIHLSLPCNKKTNVAFIK